VFDKDCLAALEYLAKSTAIKLRAGQSEAIGYFPGGGLGQGSLARFCSTAGQSSSNKQDSRII